MASTTTEGRIDLRRGSSKLFLFGIQCTITQHAIVSSGLAQPVVRLPVSFLKKFSLKKPRQVFNIQWLRLSAQRSLSKTCRDEISIHISTKVERVAPMFIHLTKTS